MVNSLSQENRSMPSRGAIMAGLAAEVSFATLPLVVVVIVLIHIGHGPKILSHPEWSFGASILFGQTLVKFTSGLARRGHAATGPFALAVALIIVFALVPSLLVLTLALQTAEGGLVAGPWLRAFQLTLFLLSAAAYMVLGAVGEVASL